MTAPGTAAPPAAVARSCGHCGAPLRANARFCPNCGAAAGARPAAGAWVPAPAQAGAAGRGAAGPARQGTFARLPALVKLGALFLGLTFVGALVQAVLPPQHRCVYSCGPSAGPLEPDAHSYPSSASQAASLGFSFGYPASMAMAPAQFGAEVAFQEPDGGQLLVWSGHGHQDLAVLVQSTLQKIGPPVVGAEPAGPVPGAQVGFAPGQGEFYCANYDEGGGQLVPVLLAVVAAQSGGTWAAVAGYTPNAPNGAYLCNWKSGFGNQDVMGYDDVLARWRWTSP